MPTERDEDPQALLARLREDYRDLLERLESNQQRFARLARSVFRVQEDERRRLARELHDGIGQNLTALKHHLALLQAALPEADDGSRRRAELAAALCAQTLEETRRLSHLLRPQVLDDLGLEPALRWLVRTLCEPAGVHCELEVGVLPATDGDAQTLLFRLAQEALTNVVKHAAARHAWVRLRARGGGRWLEVEIEDDGRGCPPEALQSSLGSGVGGMRERVALHGGAFAIGPGRDGGCRLNARIPLDSDAGAAQD